MERKILFFTILFLSVISAQAKEMRCGEEAFPSYPVIASQQQHVYCLKACSEQKGFIYVVRDTEDHPGTVNDRARFRFLQSKFMANKSGIYGDERILQTDPDVQCLITNRLSETMPLVSVIADFKASNKEKEKIMVQIGKIGVHVADEANVVLDQIRTLTKNMDCGDNDVITFINTSSKFDGGTYDNQEIAIANLNEQYIMAVAKNLSNGKKQEVFQCYSFKGRELLQQFANNLLEFRNDIDRATANEDK